jgi:hypothetical protein
VFSIRWRTPLTWMTPLVTLASRSGAPSRRYRRRASIITILWNHGVKLLRVGGAV